MFPKLHSRICQSDSQGTSFSQTRHEVRMQPFQTGSEFVCTVSGPRNINLRVSRMTLG